MEHVKQQTIGGCYFHDLAEISTRTKTPEGFLDVQAVISRSGIQVYSAAELGIQDVDPAQQILVLRTANEVFSPESMNSFARKPITVEHPSVLLDSSNTRFHGVGFSGETIVKEKNTTKTTLRITDQRAIDSIESGKVQLSCGYQADIEIKDGNDPDFGVFNAIQKNIRGNHIAIVSKGRAGDTCKIQDQNINDNSGVEKMKMIVDGITIEVTEQGKQVIEKQTKTLTDSAKALVDAETTHKAAIDKLTVDHKAATDKLQGELDGAKKLIPDAEQLDALGAERSKIVLVAKKIVKDYDPAGKTNMEVKKAVIEAKHKGIKLDDKDDTYIDGMFNSLTYAFEKGGDNLEQAFADHHSSITDEDEKDPVEEARQKKMKESENAHKGEKKD